MKQIPLGFEALKSMPAQFAGHCKRCGMFFPKGRTILYDVQKRFSYGPCCVAIVRSEMDGVRKAGK